MMRLQFIPDVVVACDLNAANLFTAIRKLHAIVPVKELLIDLKDAQSQKFLYRLTTDESTPRVCKQFLYPAPVIEDARMTYDAPDPWKYAEFAPQREVRDLVLTLLARYPTLVMIKYDVT